MNTRFQHGFNLLELMAALAVLGILFSLGVPSFTQMVRDNRVVAETNELVVALSVARSEAVKRGLPVAVCARTGPTTNVCQTGTSNNWANGWLVFTDQRAPQAKSAPTTRSCSDSMRCTGRRRVLTNNRPVVRFGALGPAAERRGRHYVHDQAHRMHRQQSAHSQDHRDRTPAHQQGSMPMSRLRTALSRRAQSGMTLVEVLVTAVMISVGLLGVAALQLTSLKSNQESYVRSQAAMLAADLLDRMRANQAGFAPATTKWPGHRLDRHVQRARSLPTTS